MGAVPLDAVFVSRDDATLCLRERRGGRSRRLELHPTDSKYFFVYPFVKTREWYQLPLEERQAMMNDHIRIGRKYPSVKLNTTYSFGLDDQEFVVSFETDEPADFLDLVMELREAKTSLYTLRDTPIFTCIAMGVRETLDTLDGTENVTKQAFPRSMNGVGWTPVCFLKDLTEGSARVVYAAGEQVALFNVNGAIYAVANRCTHANGPLADGALEGDDGNVPISRLKVRPDDGRAVVWTGVAPTLTVRGPDRSRPSVPRADGQSAGAALRGAR